MKCVIFCLWFHRKCWCSEKVKWGVCACVGRKILSPYLILKALEDLWKVLMWRNNEQRHVPACPQTLSPTHSPLHSLTPTHSPPPHYLYLTRTHIHTLTIPYTYWLYMSDQWDTILCMGPLGWVPILFILHLSLIYTQRHHFYNWFWYKKSVWSCQLPLFKMKTEIFLLFLYETDLGAGPCYSLHTSLKKIFTALYRDFKSWLG